MIKFKSFGHINIVVDDIEKATAFYQESFGAMPVQDVPHFRNPGFAKAAGFLSDPEGLDVSIRFLALPVPAPVLLELMRYHSPRGSDALPSFRTHDRGGPRHICLRVENIMEAFEHLKGCKGMRMINESADYRPHKLDDVRPEQFRLYDPQLEANAQAKEKLARGASSTTFFYVIDPYGVQWELEQADG